MFKKTLMSEFFTTINLNIFLRTLSFLTYKLPFIRYGKYVENLENGFLWYIWNFDSRIISFYNWRSAIYHSLKMIWVTKNDEVIVSWYTCVSVSNAVIQSWAKIIYSDIEKNNLWYDLKKLKQNITKNTKVIIVQYTFWKPNNIEKIIELAKDHKILIIEDCAHSLWSKIKWKKLWSFWDFSIFSIGRDKVISWITGWFLIINNQKYFNKIDSIKEKLNMPPIWLTFRNLFYNIVAYKSYKLYDFFSLWKMIIFLSRKFNIITEILTEKEKKCNFKEFNYKLLNSSAFLAFKELQKIKLTNIYKISIANYYNNMIDNKYIKILFKEEKQNKNNYFRYPILLESEEIKKELYHYMKKNNILLWKSWSGINIVPEWVNLTNTNYILWKCLVAENISKRILILPNHSLITFKDIKKIVQLLNNFKK